MMIPVLVLGVLGFFPYLHRLPKDPGIPYSQNRRKDLLHLFWHLWPLLLILILILALKLSVVPAVAVVILLSAVIHHFRMNELAPMLCNAFEWKLLLNTFLVLVLKEFIVYVGMLDTLPEIFSKLPIPSYFIFVILFFVGGIVSGANGIIAMGAPIAFAAFDGGMPFVVLLMCICHAASQISPTHVCLVVAADYFKITLGELICKTLPAAITFCILMIGYYQLLLAMGIH